MFAGCLLQILQKLIHGFGPIILGGGPHGGFEHLPLVVEEETGGEGGYIRQGVGPERVAGEDVGVSHAGLGHDLVCQL